nr:polysaccharide biosynthesis protein [Nocardia panacis]
MSGVRRLPVVADLTLVTGGAMVANVAGYLLQLLAGRWLGVAGYSEFASLLAVQLLCAVPALALQNVVARELVLGTGIARLRGLGLRCAVLVAVAAAVLILPVTLLLNVGAASSAAALGAAPALVLLAGEEGILQGSRRFRTLAIVLGVAGVARVVPAVATLALGGGAAAALWAAAAGIALSAAYARFVVGPSTTVEEAAHSSRQTAHRPGESRDSTVDSLDTAAEGRGTAVDGRDSAVDSCDTTAGSRGSAVDNSDNPRARIADVLPVLRAAQVQAALMALQSADLIVARIVLDEADASRYALGTIAAKIAFWLPQAVGVVLYPRMAQPTHSARAVREALAVLFGIGIVAVVGAAVAAPLAPLLAGRDYAPIQGMLWLFALNGAILAVLQGALLSAIAADRTSPAAITWLGLMVQVIVLLAAARSVPALILTAVCLTAVTTSLVTITVLRSGSANSAETGSDSR